MDCDQPIAMLDLSVLHSSWSAARPMKRIRLDLKLPSAEHTVKHPHDTKAMCGVKQVKLVVQHPAKDAPDACSGAAAHTLLLLLINPTVSIGQRADG